MSSHSPTSVFTLTAFLLHVVGGCCAHHSHLAQLAFGAGRPAECHGHERLDHADEDAASCKSGPSLRVAHRSCDHQESVGVEGESASKRGWADVHHAGLGSPIAAGLSLAGHECPEDRCDEGACAYIVPPVVKPLCCPSALPANLPIAQTIAQLGALVNTSAPVPYWRYGAASRPRAHSLLETWLL